MAALEACGYTQFKLVSQGAYVALLPASLCASCAPLPATHRPALPATRTVATANVASTVALALAGAASAGLPAGESAPHACMDNLPSSLPKNQ